jgi:hypothetical protein
MPLKEINLMTTETLTPPIDLLKDFETLQMMIFDDVAGDKTRRLVGYFEEASNKSLEMQVQSVEFEDKEYARLIHEAFVAAKRIVLVAWKTAHQSELVV